MNFQRRLVRIVLGGAGLFAVSVGITALRQEGGLSPAAWATLAAVLAVIAAALSGWTGQRMVELQEDALEPSLLAVLDARSRYQLVQLRLMNRGQSAAFDIKIEWDNAPTDREGHVVAFGPGGVLPVLNPGENASLVLDASHAFFAKHVDATFSGRVSFTTASGDSRSKAILVSAEHERRALVHDSEEPKTHYEIQKLPEKLESIATELEKLRKAVGQVDDND
jgi:hypothetical protein